MPGGKLGGTKLCSLRLTETTNWEGKNTKIVRNRNGERGDLRLLSSFAIGEEEMPKRQKGKIKRGDSKNEKTG